MNPATDHTDRQREPLRFLPSGQRSRVGYRQCKGDALEIVARVCIEHGVEPSDLFGLTRLRPVALARHDAMHALYEAGVYSLPEIGRLLNRDRTGVWHGVRSHAARIDGRNYSAEKRARGVVGR